MSYSATSTRQRMLRILVRSVDVGGPVGLLSLGSTFSNAALDPGQVRPALSDLHAYLTVLALDSALLVGETRAGRSAGEALRLTLDHATIDALLAGVTPAVLAHVLVPDRWPPPCLGPDG